MFALLIFIYSFMAAFIVGLLLRFGLRIISKALSVAWWIVKNVCTLLWKVVRWSVLLIVELVRTDSVQAE